MSALVKKSRKGYKLTKEGFAYVTELLEEGGYFPKIDMTGFEANAVWAGIMGTHMVEAAGKYLQEKSAVQDDLDEDSMSEVALVGLYLSIVQAQVDESLKGKRK